ncbi:MAG: lipid A deacylase LpxR family protein, partial [Thermodesulfobacteriota bacterium]|nr:lipid A deacylase LpxR family protein [Thermodesulfobacteriota bacterium]
HDLINKFRSEGWEHQLDNEPGLMFAWQRSIRAWAWRLENEMGLDFIPHVGACLGNVHTYANMGGEARFGLRLPGNFGSPLIRPGGVVNTPSDETGAHASKRWGWHMFAGTDGRAVARNIFLDGNTWKQSHRVEKKHFVADVYGGLSVRYKAVSLTYTHAFRTEEFNGQKDGQIFGSLNLTFSSRCLSDVLSDLFKK